jgi:phosphate uptake regulator
MPLRTGCLILFATQQPIAHDLRLLAAILEVITELERMGDYAKGIAKISLKSAMMIHRSRPARSAAWVTWLWVCCIGR